jgi:hypothetical protein
MAWLAAHYKDLILAVLAIDAALIPLLPNVPILVKIKELLQGLAK